MLADLVVEEVSLGIGFLSREADEFAALVLYSYVEAAAPGIGEAGNALQPSFDILAVETKLRTPSPDLR